MRQIKKRQEPESLRSWRARCQADPQGAGINYSYYALRQNETVTCELVQALVAEQGGLCAYTGMRISRERCHIEHLKAQAHCEMGEDVAYTNLVACWPWPNCGFKAGFGAHAKEDWPGPTEQHLFVSPLSDGCERRFAVNRHGEICAAQANDFAAETTIERLNLDERRERASGLQRKLTAWRKEAIAGVLGKCQQLNPKDARTRLNDLEVREKELEHGASITLAPFCFAVRQALVRHIKKVEAIREQLARTPVGRAHRPE